MNPSDDPPARPARPAPAGRCTDTVVIVGGAVVGCAVAYFLLAHRRFAGQVVVLERDPGYGACATTRSVASIRHQFSTPVNIAMSMFGTTFIRGAQRTLAVDGEGPDLAFREGGYLFLAAADGEAVLRRNHARQQAAGADIVLMDPAELRERWPWLATDGLALGAYGRSGEGWLDAHALMHGFRRKALALGAQVRAAEASGVIVDGGRARGVRLADGEEVAADWVVNAAGIGATALAATAGIALPVRPRKRCVFHLRTPAALPGCPLLIDPSGAYLRPEGSGFLCGAAPPEHDDPDCTDFDVTWPIWEERLWPVLAARVPGLEAARVASAWAGHYDVNTLDHNAIVGPHPALPNLLFANGFSGHGLQQSPAVGRGLAEWIVDGGWTSLDLSPLSWQRVLQQRPLREENVV